MPETEVYEMKETIKSDWSDPISAYTVLQGAPLVHQFNYALLTQAVEAMHTDPALGYQN